MSKLEIFKSQITQLPHDALAKRIDLLAMSQRQKADWLGIKWDQFRRNFEWIDQLLKFLYSNVSQNLTENPDLSNEQSLNSGKRRCRFSLVTPTLKMSRFLFPNRSIILSLPKIPIT